MIRKITISALLLFLLSACATKPPAATPDVHHTQEYEQRWKEYTQEKPEEELKPALPGREVTLREEDKLLVDKVRWYSVHWMGMHIGDLFADIKYNDGVYYLRTVTQARGLAWMVSKFKGDSLSLFQFNEGGYHPLLYDTSYHVRDKHRQIHIEYALDGSISKESNVPSENPLKRPPVPQEFKKGTFDPLAIGFAARQAMGEGKKEFTLPLYNGRSRSDIHFKVEKTTPEGRIPLALWQEPVAGHTDNELEDIRERRIMIRLYLEPKTLMPLFGKGESMVGTAILRFRRSCDTLDACMGLSVD